MYKLLLILKYLRRKLAPLFAALAVTLCTAMVIIVISVMGGFLDKISASAHQLSGDVIVMGNTYNGFPYYEQLIKKLNASPAISASTPIIETFGLLQLGNRTMKVSVEGIRPNGLDKVVPYRKFLYWSKQDYLDELNQTYQSELKSLTHLSGKADKQNKKTYAENKKQLKEWYDENKKSIDNMHLKSDAMNLNQPADQIGQVAPIVPGIAVVNSRNQKGKYNIQTNAINRRMVLTVMPISNKGATTQTSVHQVRCVNEFKSGLYQIDDTRVYVGFNLLQNMMFMSPAKEVDMDTGEPTGKISPGRASEIYVKGASGYSEAQIMQVTQAAISELMQEHPSMPTITPITWHERYGRFLGAVANERGLLTFLFVIISIVAVVMVATTFYMTVLEKTRDIGVLRAIGASRAGIMSIFLGYGLAIGIVGALAGLGLAWAIVTHLNQIQAGIADLTGWQMWNPEFYIFDRIPDKVEWYSATIITIGAVISSVIGSLIPAIIAAMLNPVEALGHE